MENKTEGESNKESRWWDGILSAYQ